MAIAITADGVEVTQRWRDQRGVYRPAREVIDVRAYEVAPTRKFAPVREFIRRHHYSRSTSQITRAFDFHGPGGELVGTATFGEVPRMFRPYDGGSPQGWLCLTRIVLLDKVGANAESRFIAGCFAFARREGYVGIVSYSDPVPRVDTTGALVFRGHYGGIYQSSNAVYLGTTKPTTKYLLPDGTVFESRCEQKVKTGDVGADYSAAILVAHGAEPMRASDNRGEWVRRWRDRLCRPLFHSGNFRYQWTLDKRLRRHLPESLRYPKLVLPVQLSP